MSKNILILLYVSGCLLISSCGISLTPEKLYGEWKYVRVENPNNNPPDSVSSMELAKKSPSISFSNDGSLRIMWGGEQLSAGKFRLEGDMIRYTENLSEGGTRQFPFIVRKITDTEIVFETMVQQVTRVTARKVK